MSNNALVTIETKNDQEAFRQLEANAEHLKVSTAISLMITNRQRDQLRVLGFTDETIRSMTPAEAHRHLQLDQAES